MSRAKAMRELLVRRRPSDLSLMAHRSQRGGEVACRLYSLVLSYKQRGADSQVYIEVLLMRVSKTPAPEIAGLMTRGRSPVR
jgi:hypothetical protein